MSMNAYRNEAGEYTAIEYEYDGPPDPDKFYDDSGLWAEVNEELLDENGAMP